MQTSVFQLGLISALSLGLGLAVSSRTAIGYPTGAVSYGANPVLSMGATIEGSGSLTIFEADADTDIVVTDLVLSVADNQSDCSMVYIATFTLTDGSNVAVASVGVGRNYYYGSGYTSIVPIQFASGIRVPAGQTLTMNTNRTLSTSCGADRMNVTASGYLAQP